LSCAQIWNIHVEQEKDSRPVKLNEKKNKGDIFLLEEQHENFLAAMRK